MIALINRRSDPDQNEAEGVVGGYGTRPLVDGEDPQQEADESDVKEVAWDWDRVW